MNTIKIEKNELTINLRDVKKGQIVNIIINEKTNNTEELLAAILAELQKSEIKEVEIEQEKSKIDIFNFWDSVNPKAVEAIKKATEGKTKRWKPKIGEDYLFWNGYEAKKNTWIGKLSDDALYETGNIYRLNKEELLLWEQVTRRKYETALWDAADWVETCDTNPWCVSWSNDEKKLIAQSNDEDKYYNIPRFATKQSAIDAHTRILGDDAESYFKGRG
jgi:hypothetical protein